jgi:hypothetical protein
MRGRRDVRRGLCIVGVFALAWAPAGVAAKQTGPTTTTTRASTPAAKPVPVSIYEDPTGTRQGADSVETIRKLGDGKYQLEVQNTSDIGYINTFDWHPPAALTITAITSSEGGRCHLKAGAISCSGGGKGLTPPQCTCLPGGFLTVNFTAIGLDPTFSNGTWTHYGMVGAYLVITTVTPVPYHIPSFLSPGYDLPLCAQDQISTASKPCAVA